jgi:hypothetical protein
MALKLPAHLTLDTQKECGVRTARAFDRLRQFTVAVKQATGTVPVEALEHEWRLLQQQFPGPFLTPIEFYRTGPDWAYLTSRWIDGEPFDSFLREHEGPETYAVVQEALLGLARLHRAGHVHGDIRSENLLVAVRPGSTRVYWLDLEHAANFGCLSAGFNYTESWRNNAPEGGEALSPRGDLLVFGELLAFSLKAHPVPGSRSIALLREFAEQLADSFGRAQIGDAEEARYALAGLAATRSVAVPAPPPADLRPPVPVVNRRAEEQWRQLLAHWRLQGGRRMIRVSGPHSCGKTTFLKRALTDAATRGHRVLDLLSDPMGTSIALADAELLRSFLGDSALPPLLSLRPQDVETHFDRLADALPPAALVLVEMSAEAAPVHSLSLPHAWALDDWAFPLLSAREWFQWVGASI